jgi:hypothetical protein
MTGVDKIKEVRILKGISGFAIKEIVRRTKYYYLSGSVPLSFGTFNLSWMQLTTQDLLKTEGEIDGQGNPVIDPLTGKQKVRILGTFDSTDNAYFIAYGRSIKDNLKVGANLKIISRSLGTNSGTGWGLDLGGIYTLINKLNVGLVLQDLNQTPIKWDTGTTDKTPLNLKVGLAYNLLDLDDNSLTISSDLSQRIKKDHSLLYHFGAEWIIARMVSLRLGYDDKSLTAGAGFMMEIADITASADYAYVTNEEFNNTHRISLSIKF